LESAREDLAKTVITAPISGVVSQLFAKQGEVVVTGTMNNPGTRIMVVSDLSKMMVRCRVDEGDAPLVQPDQPARVYLQSNTRRSVPGRVMSVATGGTKAVGRDVVTFEALVMITEADESVKPGMTANVEIEVDRRADALTVPVEAVVYRKRRDLPKELVAAHDEQVAGDEEAAERSAQYVKLVFCVNDGKAEARLVDTGISDTQRVEIVDGIAAGDQVVTGPYRSLDQLADKSTVKVTREIKPSEEPAEPAVARAEPSAAESADAATNSTESAGTQETTPVEHSQASAD
ncbi:MAG TPA: HlyD family efflux transporter periplasmic adaptor subunit, partial [Phycisphaerae bacterium]|nr:HlyD family efflux transporter periplasmic adaptor subunit [Phycisphaerae bacterium]